MVADYPLDAPGSAWDWTHAVADLATASAVLAGGRDGATLALKAGVPFVVFGAERRRHGVRRHPRGLPGGAPAARPLDARVRAALEAREWFREAAARCQARGPADTFSRLRPSMALSGRDDTWTGSIDGTLDVVRHLTPAGGSVLHAGAGQGQLVEALARAGLRSWGADVARHLDGRSHALLKGRPTALPSSPITSSRRWSCRPTGSNTWKWTTSKQPSPGAAGVGKEAVVDRGLGPSASRRPRLRGCVSVPEWWRRRLADLGLGLHDAADTCVTHGAGPTGGTLLVLSTQAHLCCRLPSGARADRDGRAPCTPAC